MDNDVIYEHTLGYWPVVTLVLTALTVFAVVAILRNLLRWIGAPVPVPKSVCVCMVDKVGMVVAPSCTCPMPAPFNYRPLPEPVPHEGAHETSPILAPLKPLTDAGRAALATDTAEWTVVFLGDEPEPKAVWTVEDELGGWNPDEVDWLEPATYVETVAYAVRAIPGLLNASAQRRLAQQFRAETIMAADAALTGS